MESFQEIFYFKGGKLSEEYLKKLIFSIENKKFDIPDVYVKDRIHIGGWCYGKILPGPFKKGYFLQGIHDAPINEIFNKIYKILFFPVLKLDATFFLNNVLKAENLFSLPFYTSADKLKKLDETIEKSRKYIIGVKLTSFNFKTGENLAECISYLSNMKILCGLEIYKRRNGEYPKKLEQLIPEIFQQLPVDPFTGKNFIYRKKEDRILIYSVGKNLKDDGGIFDLKIGKDDIVWKNKKD